MSKTECPRCHNTRRQRRGKPCRLCTRGTGFQAGQRARSTDGRIYEAQPDGSLRRVA